MQNISLDLDLHGHTWREARKEFTTFYNQALQSKTDSCFVKITVIHGYGSTGEGGVIRTNLRKLLRRLDGYLEFEDGDLLYGNPGCTVVTPLKRIPESTDLLAEQIWDYCEPAKSKNKIVGRFRRHGEASVVKAIETLVSQGRLHRQRRKKVAEYRAS